MDIHLICGEVDAVTALIEAKADVYAKDKRGRSAFDVATDNLCKEALLHGEGIVSLATEAERGEEISDTKEGGCE